MADKEVNVHVLDAAYKQFPSFVEWTSNTNVPGARWSRLKAALTRSSSALPDALARAREMVKRAAAIDTGAIEGLYDVDRGFTFTVALRQAMWETEIAKRGENVRSLFEAQLHAYDYVLDLATEAEPISEAAIRKLHEVVCRAQETYRVQTPPLGFQEQKLPKGTYKLQPNHVYTGDGSFHSYAPVDVTPIEMARLVSEFRSKPFLAAHPVVQAAYAHYCLVAIHPFADGNGRTARAFASVFTYRALSMPIMIFSDQKGQYLNALESADRGSHQSLIDFMLHRSIETMMLVKESMHTASLPSVEESLGLIRGTGQPRVGISEKEIDEAASRVLKALLDAIREESSVLENDNIRAEVEVSVVRVSRRPPLYPFKNNSISISLTPIRLPRTTAPTLPLVSAFHRYVLHWPPSEQWKAQRFRVRRVRGIERFEFGVEEAAPSISSTLQIRIGEFANSVVRVALAEFVLKVRRVNNFIASASLPNVP